LTTPDETPPACPSCAELRALVAELTERQEALEQELSRLRKDKFGKKSEKRPKVQPVSQDVARERPRNPEVAAEKRRETAERKEAFESELVSHAVPDEDRRCPECHQEGTPIGYKESIEFEYVTGHFRRRVHRRETVKCACGKHLATAEAPARVGEKTQFGPGLHAHVCVAKCADSIPLYRLEKQYERAGIPISRSALVTAFQRSGELLRPIADLILKQIAQQFIIGADETTHRLQKDGRKVWVWAFVSDTLVGYKFSTSRSGDTPVQVLGGTSGVLVVDGYSGYNAVSVPESRKRAGCLAHARRKLYELKDDHPQVQTALDLFRDVYIVEHDARSKGIVRTEAHTAMRKSRSAPAMAKLLEWLKQQAAESPPKSALSAAINYSLNNWTELTQFLEDSGIPPDNNWSERALRVVALGRKNFMFFGHEEAGENAAAIYSVVRSCEINGVDPIAYLTDVLMRVQTHPGSRLEELLPDRWQPPSPPATAPPALPPPG
jgi:transposase